MSVYRATLSDYLQSVLDYMDSLPEHDRFRKSDLSCLRKWQRTPLGNIKSADMSEMDLIAYFELTGRTCLARCVSRLVPSAIL